MRHRIVHQLSSVAGRALSVAIRTVITCTVFGTCLMLTLHYMGIPVPSPYDLIHNFDALDKLAKILT